jgi:hypothetical protein
MQNFDWKLLICVVLVLIVLIPLGNKLLYGTVWPDNEIVRQVTTFIDGALA